MSTHNIKLLFLWRNEKKKNTVVWMSLLSRAVNSLYVLVLEFGGGVDKTIIRAGIFLEGALC